MMQVLIVLFTLSVLGRCQDRFDYLDEIDREIRSENNEITSEDLETVVKRDIWYDIIQEWNKTTQECKQKLADCSTTNKFVPNEKCNLCKSACKDTGACRYGQCRKSAVRIRNLSKVCVPTEACAITVDKTALKALCKQVGNESRFCKDGHGSKKHRGRGHSRKY